MMAGNLSIEQRKWILKQCWKTENAERARTAWVEAFNNPPPTRLTIYRIRDKFDEAVLNNYTIKYHNVKQLNLYVKLTKCQYLRRTINTILYTVYLFLAHLVFVNCNWVDTRWQ